MNINMSEKELEEILSYLNSYYETSVDTNVIPLIKNLNDKLEKNKWDSIVNLSKVMNQGIDNE
jgi:hypothetical protein